MCDRKRPSQDLDANVASVFETVFCLMAEHFELFFNKYIMLVCD